MPKKTRSALLSSLFARHGQAILLLSDGISLAEWLAVGAHSVAGTPVSPTKSVFENLIAPLAASGIPWETAQECIAQAHHFWELGDTIDALNRPAAGTLVERQKLALAAALSAKPAGAALVISACELSPSLTAKLRARAIAESFAVIIEGLHPADAYRLGVDAVAVFCEINGHEKIRICAPDDLFLSPETLAVAQKIHAFCGNTFSGKLINAGAGEFFAEALGKKIQGKLCGITDEADIPVESTITLFFPPTIFRIDAFPPEENFFEIENGGAISFDGQLFKRTFRVKDTNATLCVASQHRQSLELPKGSSLYAWFFPEDALGWAIMNQKEGASS